MLIIFACMFQLFGVVVVVYHCTDHWLCSVGGKQCTNMKLGLWEIQFPQIWGDSEERYRCKFQWERNLISLRNKSMWQFPWIWGAEWAPSDFEGVFRHFVMNLSDFFWLQTRVNAHGRDNQSFPTSLVPKKWLYLASTFFAPALRGSPHSSQNQIRNKSKWQSDDETSGLA